MRQQTRSSQNLFEMTPCRVHEWATADDGNVRVLVPRYGTTKLGLWVARSVGKQHIPVRLDDIGSAVWKACDGSTTVGEIARRLSDQFGEKVSPIETRMSRFFAEMERGRLICWSEQVTPTAG